jgi:hypothetical protein
MGYGSVTQKVLSPVKSILQKLNNFNMRTTHGMQDVGAVLNFPPLQ